MSKDWDNNGTSTSFRHLMEDHCRIEGLEESFEVGQIAVQMKRALTSTCTDIGGAPKATGRGNIKPQRWEGLTKPHSNQLKDVNNKLK